MIIELIKSDIIYLFIIQYIKRGMLSVGKSVCDIATGCFRGTHDLHDLAPLNSVVAGYGVLHLDLGQLSVLDSILLEQLMLLLVCENLMLGDKFVLSDVHKQLTLIEEFNFTRLHLLKVLSSLKSNINLLCERPVWSPL